ncbi:MAG: peptidyl-prolyl cis-trans isomerase [Caryophanon sp.]|nr:peptidyl-prolyl cis-trans isomerase [Caryophanon sp.]
MEFILPLNGKTKFSLTLDPTVWIFDDRKVDLTTYFAEARNVDDADEKYLDAVGKHWSREIMEGAVYPPTLKTERKFDRKGMQTGTFGMVLAPFIKNAEPADDATEVVFETASGQHAFPIDEARELVLKFAQEGKPLKEDGPVHVLLADGSNVDNPITHVTAIRIQ